MFINRGVLHGPWLPIYGTGATIILVLLARFRKKPFAEFVLAIVLSGCVEYFTGWYLEMTHGGLKWWDYSGYFLNINGRVCAEGLLTFGIAGVVVYYLGPVLDQALRKLRPWLAVTLSAVLLAVFMADNLYSSAHPNTGDGITDVTASVAVIAEETGLRGDFDETAPASERLRIPGRAGGAAVYHYRNMRRKP